MAPHRHSRHRILIIGALILLVGLIGLSGVLQERADQIIAWTEQIIARAPMFGMLVFVLLAMASAMVAFFSSAFLAPIAINAWGAGTCAALLWCGWLLGGVASFCIGRFLRHSVATSLVGEDKILYWEGRISERARFRHILFFQAVVPSEIPGYVLGILRYRFLLYLAALAITEVPYAIGVVYLGESFLRGETTVFVLLGAVMIVIGALWLRKRTEASTAGKPMQ